MNVPDTADELLEAWDLPSGDLYHMLMKDDSRPCEFTPGPIMEWGPEEELTRSGMGSVAGAGSPGATCTAGRPSAQARIASGWWWCLPRSGGYGPQEDSDGPEISTHSITQGQCWQAVSVAPGAIRNAFRGADQLRNLAPLT